MSSDPVGLYRANPAADQSELHMVVGDVTDTNDKFSTGRLPGTTAEGDIPAGSFTPTFIVRADGNVGVSTSTLTSTLQVAGSVAASIRTLSSGTIASTDYTVLVTGNISLPAPDATNVGRFYYLIYGSTSGTASYTVTGAFRDIGPIGATTPTSFVLSSNSSNRAITVQSDGTYWWILTLR